MAEDADCLSPEDLRRYASGGLPVEDLERADEHVAACASCRARLMPPSRLAAATASLVSGLQEPLDAGCLDDETVAAYVAGALSPSEQERAESHLRGCALCAEDVRSLRAFREEMAVLPKRVYAPARRSPSWFHWWERLRSLFASPGFFALAPAALCLAALALSLHQRSLNAELSAELRSLRGSLDAVQAEARRASEEAQRMQELARARERELGQSEAARREQARRLASIDEQLRRREMELMEIRRSAPSPPAAPPPPERQVVVLEDGTAPIRMTLPPGITLSSQAAQATKELWKNGNAAPKGPVRLAMASWSDRMTQRIRSGTPGGEGQTVTLTSPVHTFLITLQPTFRWKAVRGADRYILSLFHQEAPNRTLGTPLVTEGTQADFDDYRRRLQPLQPGRKYLWRVRALRGETILGEGEGYFGVLAEKERQEILTLRRRYDGMHTVLAAIYQREGLYEDAMRELEALVAQNPGNALARYLLEAAREQRALTSPTQP